MNTTEIDPGDMHEYRAFLDSRGRSPANFRVVASPGNASEGELSPSGRTVSVSHSPTGAAEVYSYRTWVAAFKADLDGGLFGK